MAREFKIKTISSTEPINDLHFTVTTAFQDLLSDFTYAELLESDDLNALVSNANIVTEDENADPINSFGNTQVDYQYENFKGVLQIIPSIITPSTLIADQDDYNPTGFSTANMMRLNLSGDRVVTGFEAPPVGVDRIFYFQNISNSKLKLKNNDSSSTAANRILNKDYGEKTFKKGEGGAYWYDHTSSRWRPYTRIG